MTDSLILKTAIYLVLFTTISDTNKSAGKYYDTPSVPMYIIDTPVINKALVDSLYQPIEVVKKENATNKEIIKEIKVQQSTIQAQTKEIQRQLEQQYNQQKTKDTVVQLPIAHKKNWFQRNFHFKRKK